MGTDPIVDHDIHVRNGEKARNYGKHYSPGIAKNTIAQEDRKLTGLKPSIDFMGRKPTKTRYQLGEDPN